MNNADVKKCLDIIYNKDYPVYKNEEEDGWKKAKKAIVKAFQIGKHALVEWGIIIEDYDKYDVNYNINHNIMVKNQKAIVDYVDKFIQKAVENNPEFAQFAFNKKDKIFPLLLLMCSKMCCHVGLQKFNEIMNNGNVIKKIEDMTRIEGIIELYSTDGISTETEEKIDDFISKMI